MSKGKTLMEVYGGISNNHRIRIIDTVTGETISTHRTMRHAMARAYALLPNVTSFKVVEYGMAVPYEPEQLPDGRWIIVADVPF